jgi:hypothetical protein
MSVKKLIPLLSLTFGGLGVIACTAAAAFCWSAATRLSQVNQSAFETIDETLITVRDRILDAQGRVRESALTAEDINQSLKDFTRQKTVEQIENRLAIEQKTATLSKGLQQAESWLQLSTTSIQNVEQAFELGSSLGAPVDPASLEPLIRKLVDLQSQVSQVSASVNGLQERAAEIAGGEPQEDRMAQATALILRALATLGEVDARLGEFADRLLETRSKGEQLESTTNAYILTARIGSILLIAWMAAGQVSMCRSGWRAYRTVPSIEN